MVFGLIREVLEPTIFLIRFQYAHHDNTDVDRKQNRHVMVKQIVIMTIQLIDLLMNIWCISKYALDLK
jgi:hypothetical protein